MIFMKRIYLPSAESDHGHAAAARQADVLHDQVKVTD